MAKKPGLILLLLIFTSFIPHIVSSDDNIQININPTSGQQGSIITVTLQNWNQTEWLGAWPTITIQDSKKDYQAFNLSPVWDPNTESPMEWTQTGTNSWKRDYTIHPLAREGTNVISVLYGNLELATIQYNVIIEHTTQPPTTKKEIFGFIEDGHAHRLEEVQVTLHWDKNSDGEYEIESTTYTNNKGQYRFENQEITSPMEGTGYIQVKLTDKNNIIEIIQHNFQENKPYTKKFPIQILNENQLEQNLIFQKESSTSTDNPDSVATTYYYTHIALKFYRDVLGVTFGPSGECNLTPLQVYTFHEKGTYYSPPYSYNFPPDQIEQNPIKSQIYPGGIYISKKQSLWNNPNAPKNREWHEFSHYVMDNIIGRNPEMFYKPLIPYLVEPWNDLNLDDKYDSNEPFEDKNNNGIWDQDLNHGGPNKPHSFYNNLRTSDSWIEGFAMFMGCVIADYAKNQNYTYNKVKLQPYMYPVSKDQTQAVPNNFEVGYKDYLDEESAVASILWDLYDSTLEDNIQISINNLWSVIKKTHTFPQYWTINYNTIPSTINYLIDFDFQETFTETRPISCIKDLYDTLINTFPNKKAQIDQIFINAYIVIWDEYYFDKNNNNKYEKEIDEWKNEFDRDNNGQYTPKLPKELYIIGITDSSRPFRRNKSPTPGSTLILEVNELPCDLKITIEYSSPHEDLSYSETFSITESPCEFYFTINPTQDDQPPHRAHLTIQKQGYQTSEPLTINSDYYWENVETPKQQLLYHNFSIESDPNSNIPNEFIQLIEALFSEFRLTIAIALIGFVIILIIVLYSRSKRKRTKNEIRIKF